MKFSVRAILVLLVVIATAPVFLMIVETYISERNNAIDKATASLRNQAQLRANSQEQLFEGARNMLVAIAHAGQALNQTPRECSVSLRELKAHFPDLLNLGYTDPEGKLVCQSRVDTTPVYLGDREYFQRAVHTGEFTLGEHLITRRLHKSAFVFSLPVYTPAGKLHGVLYSVVGLEAMQREFGKMPVSPDTTDLITDLRGVVLVSGGQRMQRAGDRVADEFVFKAIQDGLSLIARAPDNRGKQWLYAVQFAKSDVGSGGMVAVSVMSADTIMGPAVQRLWLQLAMLMLIMLLASLVAWRLGDVLLARPIKRLLAKLGAMEGGDTLKSEATTPDAIQVHELSKIGDGITQLAAALEARSLQLDRALAQILEQKKTLKRSEQRYRAQFEDSPQPMWVVDRDTLAFLAVNDAAIVHYGYSREEFMGMTLREIRPVEDLALLLKMEEGRSGPRDAIPARHVRKDGDLIHVESAAHDIEWEGHPARAVSVYDVTSRVLAEAAWQRLQETLEQEVAQRTHELASANEELEAFSYSVSHDLRAPLQVIDGFCSALIEEHSDALPAKANHYLERIRAGTQKMNALIADLLSLSRVGRAPLIFRRVDLAPVAGNVVAQLRQRFPERNVSVEIEQPLLALGDESLLSIVLENLIGNAWKFTSRIPDAMIRVAQLSAEEGRAMTYVVSDNGAGFDTAYAGKLFKPFQRLHSPDEFEGNGIGLALVHRIVHRHGGRAWAESQVGKGAQFYFSLPQ